MDKIEMDVTHKIAKRELKSEVFANLLLTNGIGGFFLYSPAPFSKYNGLFFNEGMELYKTIESIKPVGCKDVAAIENNFHSLAIDRVDSKETYFVPMGGNGLYYELSHEQNHERSQNDSNAGTGAGMPNTVEINLDCRKAYDGRSFGRYYDVFPEDGLIIIKYTKRKDKAEDGLSGDVFDSADYTLYTAIMCDNPQYSSIGRWYEQFYPFDHERKENPSRWAYSAIALNARKLAFGFSVSKDKAIAEARHLYLNKDSLLEEKRRQVDSMKHRKIKDDLVDFAYLSSMNAMDSFLVRGADARSGDARLSVEGKESANENGEGNASGNAIPENNTSKNIMGIYAGMPWFFQFWARDSALSARSLYLIGKVDEAKDILMRYLGQIRDDGWIENRQPHADLDSADAVGLVFLRIANLIDYLDDADELAKHFSETQLKSIKAKLESAIYSMLKSHSRNGFIFNKRKETWMDTDAREGMRIEIQALQLAMYSFLRKLSKRLKDKIAYSFALHQEKMLLKKARSQFFDGFLLDGLNDRVVRPNVFLAYYIYPGLLSEKEWIMAFDYALDRLWLPWGGISTIDKTYPGFVGRHTGSDDASYHKGDSWYFMNNLCAISMYRLDKERYKEKIDGILQASTKEIVFGGIQGYHAEISSADSQTSSGCLAQAWSSAFYIELVREVLEDK